ncbi:YbaB/EbfC family DNA-binding protein [Mycoplasmopsis mucosicanis]|uniref:YbaB/EbfC family DNA-binding protein n=1 Tax=Mycoplasmopsis mucosicanis TaxID=458208 RepID=A0A507SR23_9BACT|nr:YbaB/EbfC family nucleoid-associated protein [Mycoplasmopsis mucosicanis]TQC51593.1 YbaB/EbfC family DNA-binding protein [Mycoplasmopsis mucosicanis]
MDQSMLRKVKKIQAEYEEKINEFENLTFKLEKHGLEVEAYGNKRIKSITIKDVDLIDPDDHQTLTDLMTLVINQLFTTIDEEEDKLTPQLPGGLGL